MMVYEVMITGQAESDLRGIQEYIAFELLSPDNAAGQLERLEEGIIELESFPEKYRIYDKEPWKSRELRVKPIDNYLVFYLTDSTQAKVMVIRVMYSGRDVEEQLTLHTQSMVIS